MSLNQTPSANRVHIGIFGKRNSGKSSLINGITNQNNAVVSDVAGTTTDPVYKAMEIHGIGPCMLMDTAGFDDVGELGDLRVEKTKLALMKTDIAILIVTDTDLELEKEWVIELKKQKTPIVAVINKIDVLENVKVIESQVEKVLGLRPVCISAKTKEGIEILKQEMIRNLPEEYEVMSITKHLVKPTDTVLLVMPQDIQAPKGRLILPQVQTIRDLLDNKCMVLCTTADHYETALNTLKEPPKLIVTDSQVFKKVYEGKPKESLLTSFSVLFATYKGDARAFVEGAYVIDRLTESSKILIAEACTHAPLSEDIGREQIPKMLRNRIGDKLQIDIVSGTDYPRDLTGYDLIIHCGACMFNRKYVLNRVEKAKEQGVPISNYGIVMAYLTGILDKISL